MKHKLIVLNFPFIQIFAFYSNHTVKKQETISLYLCYNLFRSMDFHELITRHALRYNYVRVARLLVSSLTNEMHLEFAFFIMKYIISHRKYSNYSIVRELAKQLTMHELPSTSRECSVHRIERATAYIVRKLRTLYI